MTEWVNERLPRRPTKERLNSSQWRI